MMNLELDGKSTEEFSARQSAHWQREEEQITRDARIE
jgi:hypothetical protein